MIIIQYKTLEIILRTRAGGFWANPIINIVGIWFAHANSKEKLNPQHMHTWRNQNISYNNHKDIDSNYYNDY